MSGIPSKQYNTISSGSSSSSGNGNGGRYIITIKVPIEEFIMETDAIIITMVYTTIMIGIS